MDEYINGGNYHVRIKESYDYYNLFKDEVYCVNYTILQNYELEAWNNLLKYINNKNYLINNNDIEMKIIILLKF